MILATQPEGSGFGFDWPLCLDLKVNCFVHTTILNCMNVLNWVNSHIL